MSTESRELFVHSSEEFWSAFDKDLQGAASRVIIQSPFITVRRLNQLQTTFSLLKQRRVQICVFIQEPLHWRTPQHQIGSAESANNNQLRESLQWLDLLGVHWNCIENSRETGHCRFIDSLGRKPQYSESQHHQSTQPEVAPA